MLIVDDLSIAYGRTLIVRNVSFCAQAGDVVGLEGDNGAGKSTLLSVLAGVRRPLCGRVTLDGTAFDDRRAYLAKIGYVPQSIALIPHLSGHDNLRQWGALRGLSGHALTQAVDQASALSGMTAFAHQRVNRMSGGMKRRVNLAVGLLGSPTMLILDEPSAGLDRAGCHLMIETLHTIVTRGVLVILASHNEYELGALATHRYRLSDGRLCASSD